MRSKYKLNSQMEVIRIQPELKPLPKCWYCAKQLRPEQWGTRSIQDSIGSVKAVSAYECDCGAWTSPEGVNALT